MGKRRRNPTSPKSPIRAKKIVFPPFVSTKSSTSAKNVEVSSPKNGEAPETLQSQSSMKKVEVPSPETLQSQSSMKKVEVSSPKTPKSQSLVEKVGAPLPETPLSPSNLTLLDKAPEEIPMPAVPIQVLWIIFLDILLHYFLTPVLCDYFADMSQEALAAWAFLINFVLMFCVWAYYIEYVRNNRNVFRPLIDFLITLLQCKSSTEELASEEIIISQETLEQMGLEASKQSPRLKRPPVIRRPTEAELKRKAIGKIVREKEFNKPRNSGSYCELL